MSFVATTALTEVWAKVKALFGALEDELDGKANASHAHSASDVTSGTLDIARIPTGTTSTKVALGAHNHSANDVTSGTLPVTRGGTGKTSQSAARAFLGNPPIGTCDTANGTGAKAVAMSGFALYDGARILVRFENAQTSAIALTLDVNSTGAKTVYANGAATSTSNGLKWRAYATLEFVYYTNKWIFTGLAYDDYSSGFYMGTLPTFHLPGLAASTKPSESNMPVLPCRVLLGDGSEWLYS